MRKHRRWQLWIAGGAALVVATILWLALAHRSGVTQANYQRLREGMTLQEVQNILGGPPGNYSRFPDQEAGLWALDADRPDLNRQFFLGREAWVGNELAVAVWFNEQERMVRKEAYEMPERSLLERLRELFPW